MFTKIFHLISVVAKLVTMHFWDNWSEGFQCIVNGSQAVMIYCELGELEISEMFLIHTEHVADVFNVGWMMERCSGSVLKINTSPGKMGMSSIISMIVTG